MGLEYAHSNGLVHGHLDLSAVLLTREGDTNVYKISDFRPLSSMSIPLTAEGSDWPFARQKK